ncbi:agmatine deiminase family protein [Ruegeria sp. 2012CJ41-6]|uniref:Agmatine deiminase family protein n=1 Tax=Ruegeria spongiae TaxID=2942209 RepID=A0ABT0Q3A6_9RHOB|nr:agmatine deiminase family protein [Ruegeria spongiae]MCL6283648.1 agmatine deiminase family protein [Ruegeria spongiae]
MQRRDFLASQAQLGAFCLFGGPAMAASDSTFTVPPEEAAHEATFMQWPASPRVYPDRVFLELLQHTITDIANAIAQFEPVILLAAASDHPNARKLLSDQVTLWDIPTEDLWCRDSGPLFAITSTGERVVSHIRFNGWGDRQVHKRDGRIAAEVARRLDFDLIPSGVIGEAGGVEQDGHGLLMAHESSWVNDNRNPGLTRDQIEQRLLTAYGAERMIWADGVRGEDITDYHIDSLARFTGPGRVLINLPDDPDPQDPFHMAALDTYDQLIAEGLEVEIIPEPDDRRVKTLDFVASYANYYVCNGAVIAAQFGDRETDRIAQDALQRHYPGREVVTLNVDALGEVGGGIHCATQQLPTS